MEIPKFLDLALELETEISKLYEIIAELSGDQPVAAQLRMPVSYTHLTLPTTPYV